MTADYSVSCTSDKYRFGFIWACVMVAIYPLGCPAYYFYLLYHARHDIQAREEHTPSLSIEKSESEDKEPIELSEVERVRQGKLNSLRFLFESYQPCYWWWEIAETTQRLLLTGILVLIAQGSALQIIVGGLLTLSFLHLHARYEPFSDGFVLSIKIISYWQIFFVFWIALLIKADFPSISSRSLGVCLVLTVFMNIFIDLWKVCRTACSSLSGVRWSAFSREPSENLDPERNERLASHAEMRTMSVQSRRGDNGIESPFHLAPPSSVSQHTQSSKDTTVEE
jgi:hypothetical protein